MGDTPVHKNHRARVEVAPELIAKALHFPDGTEITWASFERGVQGWTVHLVVDHPDLPEVEEGYRVPYVVPKVTYHRESWDFEWGEPQPDSTEEAGPAPVVLNPLGVIPPYEDEA